MEEAQPVSPNDIFEESYSEIYDADYYLNGIASGKSNYQAYKYLPDLTVPMASRLMSHLGIREGDTLIDIGCALGFFVKALRVLRVKSYGYDISKWAIENCHPDVKDFVSNEFPTGSYDWANLKDLGEHLYIDQLSELLSFLNKNVRMGMFFVVPLADKTGGSYLREEDERDITHIIRWTLHDWLVFLEEHAPDFNVNASYHIHGIKPASNQVRHSCGFFTLIRQ